MNLKSQSIRFGAAVLLVLAAGLSHAATLYVATTGNDTTGDGTSAKPMKTIRAGILKMKSGDTLIVKAGTYSDLPNFINSRLVTIPNGTPAQYTTIMAEQPGAVRIKNTGSLQYYDSFIFLETTQYVKVDGFILDHANSQYPPSTVDVEGSFNKVTRVIVKRSGVTEQYGGWFYFSGTDNLLEDSAGVGSARYGFAIGGPSGVAQRIIMRRCVGRMDYSISQQPKATFNVYGNDDGNFFVRDILLQNLIAIDGRKGPTVGDVTYGAYYFPKNPVNVLIQGSLALNVESEYASFFIKELQGRDIKLVDTVAWAGYGPSDVAAVRANSTSNTTDFMVFDHVTLGKHGAATYNKDGATTRQLTNSVLFGNTTLTSGSDYGWTTATANAFFPATPTIGTGSIALAATDLKYIVRAEAGSKLSGKASDGRDVGANMTVRYGRTGTMWGEAGYNERTTEPLWPWVLEDNIKAVFAETNPSPAGAVPATNDTTRGFAATTDQFGKPMTLTRYVWQYLGNEIPASIYGTGSAGLTAPTGLSATVIKK